MSNFNQACLCTDPVFWQDCPIHGEPPKTTLTTFAGNLNIEPLQKRTKTKTTLKRVAEVNDLPDTSSSHTEATSNAPQASPTIQELLEKILSEVWGYAYADGQLGQQPEKDDITKPLAAILTLFSRIITEVRPEKLTDASDEVGEQIKQAFNAALDQYEHNLRAAIAKDQPID